MKKLLAIAVTAAFTAAPMVAMADTSVYGSARILLGKNTNVPGSQYTLGDDGSRFGVKGSNAINNGLSMTHQFELRGDITGNDAAPDPTFRNDNVSLGYANVGIKGGFGHVQFGKTDTVMDDVDGGAGFLTNGSFGVQPADGSNDGQIKYTGSFGPVTALASLSPKGNRTAPSGTQSSNTKSQIGLTYKAGPFKVGVGTASNTLAGAALGKTKLALSYAGANYGVGFVHAVNGAAVKTKSNTLGGKYSFGKAYVAAALGRAKTGASTDKQTDFELGYSLGKGTKVFYQNKKTTRTGGITVSKSNALGLRHSF